MIDYVQDVLVTIVKGSDYDEWWATDKPNEFVIVHARTSKAVRVRREDLT